MRSGGISALREGTCLHKVSGPQILQDEDKPHRRIGRCESCRRSAIERVFGVGSHHGHRKHLHKRQPALHYVVRVKAGGEDGVASPRPPNQRKERREPRKADKGYSAPEAVVRPD